MPIEFREYVPADAEPVCDLLNGIFTSAPMTQEGWAAWASADFTAPVAVLDGEPVGAIPLCRRTYRAAPDAEVVAWVEHRVGVREDLRDQGVGSCMQACAKSFLQGRGDVLLVYRGAERSDGYRFYDNNGLHDVAYIRTVSLEPTDAKIDGVRWLDPDEFLAADAPWLAIFHHCYGHCGGFPQRGPGYLRRLVRGIWKGAIRTHMAYAVLEEAGQPTGYLVLGQRQASPSDGPRQVMELAVADGSVDRARRLLLAACGRGAPVHYRLTAPSPLAPVLDDLGVAWPPRQGASMIMAHVLDIESAARKVWRPVPALHDVEVRVWTPLREGVLHQPDRPARTLTIELKEPMLSRLLLRRLDLAAAVAEERITLCGARPGDPDALARALPPCPWVYHQIDYL